jgi:hypothetical protein
MLRIKQCAIHVGGHQPYSRKIHHWCVYYRRENKPLLPNYKTRFSFRLSQTPLHNVGFADGSKFLQHVTLNINLKTMKITYRIITLLYCLFIIMDGTAGLLRVQDGQDIMIHLGYPVYILTILGTAKIFGALAIIQEKFLLIKEWAYAGFTFHYLGAFASRAFAGDSFILIISPLLFMSFMFVSYFLWKKIFAIRITNEPGNSLINA